jgi:hypothetical protein
MSDLSGLGPVGTFPERVHIDGAIEIKPPPPANEKKKDAWDVLAALSPFVSSISGIVLAILAYQLTGSVEVALKREELNLSNVTEMRSLLLSLQGEKPEEWQGAAFTLSAFGVAAVPPLISALSVGDEVRSPYIESALRSIGFSHPDAVCTPMISVLDTHTGRFTWLMHKAAIRLIGDLQCRDARPVLTRYAALIEKARASGDLASYAAIVDPSTPVTARTVDSIDEELTRTRRIVERH